MFPFPDISYRACIYTRECILSHYKCIMEGGTKEGLRIYTYHTAHWLRLSSACFLSVLGDRWCLISVLHSIPRCFLGFVHCVWVLYLA